MLSSTQYCSYSRFVQDIWSTMGEYTHGFLQDPVGLRGGEAKTVQETDIK